MSRHEKRKPVAESPVDEPPIVKKRQRKAKQQDTEILQGLEMESQLDEAQQNAKYSAAGELQDCMSPNSDMDNRIVSFFDDYEDVTLVSFKPAYPVADLLKIFKENSKITGQKTGCYEIIRHTKQDMTAIMVPKKAVSKKFQELFDTDLAFRKDEAKKKQQVEEAHLKSEADRRKQQFLSKQLSTTSSLKNYPIFSKPPSSSTSGSSTVSINPPVVTKTATTAKSTLKIVKNKKVKSTTPSALQAVRQVSYYSHPNAPAISSMTTYSPSVPYPASLPVTHPTSAISSCMIIEDVDSETSENENELDVYTEEQAQTQLYLIEQEPHHTFKQSTSINRPDIEQIQTEPAIQKLQAEVKLLHTELGYLRDVCIPMVKRIGRLFNGFDEVDQTDYPYTEIPISVSKDEWKFIHPMIFGGRDEQGMQLWAETAPLKIENDIATRTSDRAGQEKPSIALSVYQFLESEGVPVSYKVPHAADVQYIHIRHWFLEYHQPYVQDVYRTVDPQKLDNDPTFFQFLCSVIENHQRNKKHSGNNSDRGRQHILGKVAAFRQRRNGAHAPSVPN
jgi:hypothetical protein